MFETLKSCRRKLVCKKTIPNVGKKSVVVCPPPQFQKESEKEACFLANSLGLFPPFAGATLGCYNVTNPQLSVDLLTCVGSRGAVVSAALSERKVAGSIPTIGDFHTVGPCKKAVFACFSITFTFTFMSGCADGVQ